MLTVMSRKLAAAHARTATAVGGKRKLALVIFGRAIALSLILPILGLALSMHEAGPADRKMLCDGVPCIIDYDFGAR